MGDLFDSNNIGIEYDAEHDIYSVFLYEKGVMLLLDTDEWNELLDALTQANRHRKARHN